MEQRSAGGHNVIECKDWRETITCVVAVLKSLHFALPQSRTNSYLSGNFSSIFSLPVLHLFVVVPESVN